MEGWQRALDPDKHFVAVLKAIQHETKSQIFVYGSYAKSLKHREDMAWIRASEAILCPENREAARELALTQVGELQQYHRNLRAWAEKFSHLSSPRQDKQAISGHLGDELVENLDVALVPLSEEQELVLDGIRNSNEPVFVTGKAGTGKSLVLKHLVRSIPKREAKIVASFTGMAARNVGGVTLHSFVLDNFFEVSLPLPSEFRTFSKQKTEVLSKLEWLIIDEISMVRGDHIDRIDRALRFAKDSNEPFGGCKLVMFGDVLQLPPFVDLPRFENEASRKWRSWLATYPSDAPEFFMAHVFSISGLKTIELEAVHRQTDSEFVECLNRIRLAEPTENDLRLINARSGKIQDVQVVSRLMGRKHQVEEFNNEKLGEIQDEKLWIFPYEVDEKSPNQEPNESYLARELPCPLVLKVKIGARVMFVRNDSQSRWVNGTAGTVVGIALDCIDVEVEGAVWSVTRSSWSLGTPFLEHSSGEIKLKTGTIVRQFPLMLAWAVTVHKAQGQTLEQVVCDFSMPYFASAQAYVALSRVVSLDGLRIVGQLNRSEHILPISSAVTNFLAGLRQFDIVTKHILPLDQEMLDAIVDLQFAERGLMEDWTSFDHWSKINYLVDQYGDTPVKYFRRAIENDYLLAVSIYWNTVGRLLGETKLRISASDKSELREKLFVSDLRLSSDEVIVAEHLALSHIHMR